VSLNVVRPQLCRAPERRRRFFQPPQTAQCDSMVVMMLRRLRRKFDRLAGSDDRLIAAAQVRQSQAEVALAIGVAGVELDRAAEHFRGA
jgi:hypothetical protein